MAKFRAAGGLPRYTLYSTNGHNTWLRAYGEPDFFSWMKSKNKANLHAYKGITTIVRSRRQYPKLVLAEGFLAYQWERNGVIISGATSNTYMATAAGTYRARFSRISSAPAASQWNKWSASVNITESTTATGSQTLAMDESELAVEGEAEFTVTPYPNPTQASNLNVQISAVGEEPVEIKLVDQYGVEHYRNTFQPETLQPDQRLNTSALPNGIYILWVNQGARQLKQRVMIRD